MGTSFTNPIPRGQRTRFNESSQLRSDRDSDVVPRIWQKNRSNEQQLFRMSQAIEQLQRELNRLRRKRGEEAGDNPPPQDWFLGEWNEDLTVVAQQAVTFTPSGGQAGTYVCILDAPVGTPPDTGTDYYVLLPNAPAGVWAF